MTLSRVIVRCHRTVRPGIMLGFLALTIPACGGGNSSSSYTPPDGQVERDADFSGRWAVRYSVNQNDCGFPAEVTDTFVDITQSARSISVSSVQGVELFQGEVSANQSMAESNADVQLRDRLLRYVNHTAFRIDGDQLMGRERFTLQDSAGNVACGGTLEWQGSRSIMRTSTADPLAAIVDTEPNDTLITAGALLPNTAVTGVVSDGDDRVDIYAMPLTHSGPHEITLSGFAGGDLNLALLDKHHNLIGTSENGEGQDEYLAFNVDAATGGAFYVVVSAVETGESPIEYLLQHGMP